MNIRKTIAPLAALILATALASAALAETTPPAAPKVQPPAPTELRQFPNRNGPLSAIAMFIPADQISEFDKPANETPRVTRVHSVGINEKVALKVMFMGPQVDANGNAYVTFDFKFMDKDGKVAGGADMKDLVALRGKVTPNAVYDNIMAVPVISFDAEDDKGPRQALVVLHDKIGGRDISMTVDLTFQ